MSKAETKHLKKREEALLKVGKGKLQNGGVEAQRPNSAGGTECLVCALHNTADFQSGALGRHLE